MTDSRHRTVFGSPTVVRRRRCKACRERFTTYELTADYVAKIKADAMSKRVSEAVTRTLAEEIGRLVARQVADELTGDRRRHNARNLKGRAEA